MTQTLTINEDNLVRFDHARRAADNTYINTGSCSYQLKDPAGNVLASGNMGYVSSSNGRWQGAIDKTLLTPDLVTEGSNYYIEVTMSDGLGADGFHRIELVAKYNDQ